MTSMNLLVDARSLSWPAAEVFSVAGRFDATLRAGKIQRFIRRHLSEHKIQMIVSQLLAKQFFIFKIRSQMMNKYVAPVRNLLRIDYF